jgi:hypothetical protein
MQYFCVSLKSILGLYGINYNGITGRNTRYILIQGRHHLIVKHSSCLTVYFAFHVRVLFAHFPLSQSLIVSRYHSSPDFFRQPYTLLKEFFLDRFDIYLAGLHAIFEGDCSRCPCRLAHSNAVRNQVEEIVGKRV